MISTNQFKSGLTLEIDGEVFVIVEYQPVKPGKGGAFVRTKMKNLRTKKVLDRTFRAEEKFQEAFVEEKKAQFLYESGHLYHFMDQDTYEEIIVDKERLSEIIPFMKENMEISIIIYQGQIIEARLPMFIELKVTHSEPGIRGDTSKSAFKPANLETGVSILVPLFVNVGDTIKIDTRTGEYVERV